MPFTFKQLMGNVQLATSATSHYAASNRKAQILKATAFNGNSSARTIDVWIVAGSGTATDLNKIIEGKSIPGNGTVILAELEGHVIETNFSLQAMASAAGSVSLTISGIEIT